MLWIFLSKTKAADQIGAAYRSLLKTTVDINRLFCWPEPPTFGIILDNACDVLYAFEAATSMCARNSSTLWSSIPKYLIWSFILILVPRILKSGLS